MRDLNPKHRTFVMEYCRLKNAAEAARRAGYKGPAPGVTAAQARAGAGGAGLWTTASNLMDRKDISDAIVEETLRRLAASLPVHVELIEEIAAGKSAVDGRVVSESVRMKALDWLGSRSAPVHLQIDQKVDVQVTVPAHWERLARMAAARGENPAGMLKNLPVATRELILGRLEGRVTEADYEDAP